MKRVFTLFTALCFFSLFTSTSYAEESTESTTSPSTTEPSGEAPAPDQTSTITFTYIDVDTHQEIAPSKSITGLVDTTVPVEVRTISGYSLSDVVLVSEVSFLLTDYSFPIHYAKIPESSEITRADQGETTPTSKAIESETTTNPSQPKATSTTNRQGDVETNTAPTSKAQGITETSLSEAVPLITSGSSSSQTTPLSSQKQKPLLPSKKSAGVLPKAGNVSNHAFTLVGFGTILASLSAYWLFKQRKG